MSTYEIASGLTVPLRALFLDAGNTLVFADLARTLAPLAALGLRPTQEQLHAAERAAKKRLDASHAAMPEDHSVDRQFWEIYYTYLLEELGKTDAALCAALGSATRQSANWSRVLPGTREVLQRLKQSYRLGVISNSDGHMADLLHSVGLGDCFESFTDSGVVGYEKPDARIFRAALQSLGVAASESMYIGDVYSVDYLGAKNAGLEAVLLDVAGTYRDSGLPRVESLAELETRLCSR